MKETKKARTHLTGNQHNKLPLDKVIGSYWRIRCTAADKLKWKVKARSAGLSDSEWTRLKFNED